MSIWFHQLDHFDIVVDGDYKPGESRSVTPATISPPDPRCIVIHHIWVGDNNDRVDILPYLKEKTIERIQSELLEHEEGV